MKAQEVRLSTSSSNTAFTFVSDGQPTTAHGLKIASSESNGAIDSMCTPYGRRSSALSAANVSLTEESGDSVFIELAATAFAAGGHYRTCGLCGPDKQCIIITGHDTSARSDATASSTTKIEFAKELNHSKFLIDVVATGAKDELVAVLRAPNGDAITIDATRRSGTTVDVKEGDVYFLELQTHAAASDTGGCCESRSTHSAGVKVLVIPAPIIAAEEALEPFIIGGAPVDNGLYDSVVAVLIDGRIHCSGAVIAPKTVLTAAHCIQGYESAIAEARVDIFVGNSIFETGSTKKVADAVYPKGEGGIRYSRSDESIEHDVGLLFLVGDIGVPAAIMHEGTPTWKDIEKKFHSELTFVGYGLKVLKNGKGSGAGVKREATWRFSSLDEWNFYFEGQSSNTCSGDSGGPAFFRDTDSGELILVGVTSAGNRKCTRGIEMRADAYGHWISPRVQ